MAARSAPLADGRLRRARYNPYETPFRPFLPSTAYALAASRHMHEFGTTREQLAEVAVAAREWALLNPVAWEKKPLTIEDVLSARPDQPSVHRARLLPDHRRWRRHRHDVGRSRTQLWRSRRSMCSAAAQAITHASISAMPDLTVTGARESGAAAYRDGADA